MRFKPVIWLILMVCIGSFTCVREGFAFDHSAAASDLYPFKDIEKAKRFDALTHEIRCVVCQNQTIAESDAPLAQDLRQKVYALVQRGKSNSVIAEYLVARYGNFILFNPPFKAATILLWGLPPLGLVFLLSYRWYVRRKK